MKRNVISSRQKHRIVIDDKAYFKWLEGRDHVLGEGLTMLRPTLRNAVLLSLLEDTEKPLTYQEILEKLQRRNVLGTISVESLRLAVSDVARVLQKTKSGYLLRSERKNRIGSFALVRREKVLDPIQEASRVLQGFQSPNVAPESIANQLVRDGGGLPFAGLYTSYRSAAQWICYSKAVTRAVTTYKTEALNAYGVLNELGIDGDTRSPLAVVGLGVGEGLGEAALLRDLLDRTQISTIHYLAVDSSEVLLLSHASLLRDQFPAEIAAGRLVIAPVCGDLFRLTEQLRIARSVKGNDFLSGMPLLVTYLGNNLGNQEGQEWSFFSSVMETFPAKSTPLAFLFEVSEARWEGTDHGRVARAENYRIDTFLLEMPRTLLERGAVVSLASDGSVIPPSESKEFTQDTDPPPELVAAEPYSTSFNVKGAVYRMHYALKHGLATGDGKFRLPARSSLHLYSIVKYDLDSLASALAARGLVVKQPRTHFHVLEKSSGAETFRCAAFAVFRK